MNILLFTTHLNTGGITSYLLTLSKGLIREGHRVYMVSSGGNQQDDFSYAGVEHLFVDIHTSSELNLRLYGALPKIRRYILEKNIHVIHAHTRVTQVLGWLLQKMTGRSYMSTCHGFFKPRLGRRMFTGWGRAVVAISQPVQEHLINDFKMKPEKVFLIPNGIEVHKFSVYREDSRKEKRRLFNLEGYQIVGIIARLADVKGHEVLIEAMTRVIRKKPQTKLLIVGEGKEEENLKHLVNKLRLNDSVYFYAVVNKTAEFMEIFDVFVMPSLDEGLGLSVLEAQASGLPVVASSVGGLKTIIEHGKTGLLVPPGDSEALADAIEDLLNHPQQAAAMGRTARAFVEKNFSSEMMVGKTIGIYEKLQEKK